MFKLWLAVDVAMSQPPFVAFLFFLDDAFNSGQRFFHLEVIFANEADPSDSAFPRVRLRAIDAGDIVKVDEYLFTVRVVQRN
jgi:hypothetical protein